MPQTRGAKPRGSCDVAGGSAHLEVGRGAITGTLFGVTSQIVLALIVLLQGLGCRAVPPPGSGARGALSADTQLSPARSRAGSTQPDSQTSLHAPTGISKIVGVDPHRHHPALQSNVTLEVHELSIGELLRQLAQRVGVPLLMADPNSGADAITVTLQVEKVSFQSLLQQLTELIPMRWSFELGLLRVSFHETQPLALLVQSLPTGTVIAQPPLDFESIRHLSFVSRSQKEGGEGGSAPTPQSTEEVGRETHIERFLRRLPELVPWPEGSTWFLDGRNNLLFIRSTAATLKAVQGCLEQLLVAPVLVEIEAQFVELASQALEQLGSEFQLTEPWTLLQDDGQPKLQLSPQTSTLFGTTFPAPGNAVGGTLSLLGTLTQPRFEALLRALRVTESAELLSAPTVATINNTRATLALTTNLPYVEDYRPVFDQQLVAADGVSTTEANVALVAVINDENFTGIVLNVTPSVGHDHELIQLHLQPVVREQVDSITISSGAVVSGVETPAIARPVIETRFIDTHLTLPSGSGVVLGGLRTRELVKETRTVPILGSIPLLGWLFSFESEREEERELIVVVTARVKEWPSR